MKVFDSWVYLLCVLRRASFRFTSERPVIWRVSCLLHALSNCVCRWRNTASSFCVLHMKIQKLRSTCLVVLSRWLHCTRMPFCLKFLESSRLLYCLPFIIIILLAFICIILLAVQGYYTDCRSLSLYCLPFIFIILLAIHFYCIACRSFLLYCLPFKVIILLAVHFESEIRI